MKKGGGSESTIIIRPSKSVLVYTLHSLEYVLGLARFRIFVPKLLYSISIQYTKEFAIPALFVKVYTTIITLGH